MKPGSNVMEVDVWIRGTNEATTQPLVKVSPDSPGWTEDDVRRLLIEMLLALEHVRNPGGEAPTVSLRGFSWIVSPAAAGVLVHLDMQIGTVSAGPFEIGERQLTDMIHRVMDPSAVTGTVH